MKKIFLLFIACLPIFGNSDIKILGERLKKDIPKLPKQISKTDVLFTLGTTAGFLVFDGKITDYVYKNYKENVGNFLRPVQPLGYVSAIGFPVLFYSVGKIFKREKEKETGLLIIEALITSGVTTGILKVVLNRSRPSGSKSSETEPYKFFDHGYSFPSGHTTIAFSLATVISEQYQKPIISVLSYGLAGIIGFERIYNSRHWTSDVWFAGLSSYFLGRAVVRLRKKNSNINLMPFLDKSNFGFSLIVKE